VKQDIAYEKLAYAILADFHSNFVANSPFAGKESTPARQAGMTAYGSPAYLAKLAAFGEVGAAQAAAFPTGCPSYQVVGDTAYVTFNSFDSASEDYYKNAPTSEAADTFGICAYAHQQISANSAIKNVVLDLSANTGGDSRAAIYTLAWFLGEPGVSIQSAATGGVATTVYRADLNLDHVFDEKDTLQGKNLFCLISPMSFSSGNLVPSFFKNTGKVTLIGQNSGGGACNVQPLVSGTGTYLTISSQRILSRAFNGSFYDIDQGVAPDIPLTKLASFYDRATLTSTLDSLK
jgi:C-terminal processing protease CtpA/Prc